MYADYKYYLNEYLHKLPGLISEQDFGHYASVASKRMDAVTWGKIKPGKDLDEVKLCCCEIAEAIYRYDQSRNNESGAPVSSWSNDGESGSYDMSCSDVTEDGHNRLVGNIARKYLLRMGMLNRRC